MADSEVLILGAGGQGREIAWIAQEAGHRVVGFLDDSPTEDTIRLVGELGLRLLGGLSTLGDYSDSTSFVIGIADGRIRSTIAARLRGQRAVAPALIHPSATIGRPTEVGPGSVVWPGARVTTSVRIGEHVHLNQNVTVGHDTIIESSATLNPAASVSGSCLIRSRTMIGANSTVLQGLVVGDSAVVGAGACVVRDVPDAVTVKGVPAR